MLTQKGNARRKLLLSSAHSALLYYPLLRMFRDNEAFAQGAGPNALFAMFPTGFSAGNFWFGGNSGPLGAFKPVLKPIEELGLKDEFLLLDGLNFHGSCNHNGGVTQTFGGWGAAGLWEGAGIKYQGNKIDESTWDGMNQRPYSLDQQLADKWKAECVVLGVASRKTVFNDPFSWKKDGVKNRAEDNPKVTFDRYFGNFKPGTGGGNTGADAAKKVAAAEKRILDFLVSDVKRIESNLGSEDKIAFQSHLSALDDINAELDKAMKDPVMKPEDLSQCKPEKILEELGNVTGDWFVDDPTIYKVFKIQRAIITQLFACGIARIAVWQIGGGHVTTQLRAEGVSAKTMDHHQLSHLADAAYEDIQRGHIREIGKLAVDLKNAKVGGKSILDNTMYYVASDSGQTGHVKYQVPAFFLSSMGGKIKCGRQIKYNGKIYNHALITAAHLVGATDINQIGNTVAAGPLDEVLKG